MPLCGAPPRIPNGLVITASLVDGQAQPSVLTSPFSPEKMVEYQNTNRKDQVAYEEDERLIASVNHLNVLDKFSVTLLELGELLIFVSVSFRALASSGV